VTFEITPNSGFTKVLDLDVFLESKTAEELGSQISDYNQRLTWKRDLKAHYEITSGKPFDMLITLIDREE